MSIYANQSENGNLLFAVLGNGTINEVLPHFWVSNGGPGLASGFSRSLMLISENSSVIGTSNISSCQAYMDSVGEILQIDCDTSNGADLLVGDDLQVIGDVWVKDAEGEWHFLSESLSLLDEEFNNILFNRLNSSVSGGILSIIDKLGGNLVINLNRLESRFIIANDSLALTQGTNTSPVRNIVSYQTSGNPSLVTETTTPTVDYANVADLLLGDGDNVFGGISGQMHVDTVIKHTLERLFEEGTVYISGFNPTVTSTEVNFSNGEMIVIISRHAHNGSFNLTSDGYFFVRSNGTYVESVTINDIDEYSDGNSISNNKYFNIVFGIIHNDFQKPRIMGIVSTKPSSEYTSTSAAEADSGMTTKFFPSDSLLKGLFVPIVRVVMQRTGGTTNTMQVLSDGMFHFDIRGTLGATGGASPSPSITDHGDLSGLADDDHVQYLLADGTRSLSADWAVGSFSITGVDDLNATEVYQNGNLCLDVADTFSGDVTGTSSTTVVGDDSHLHAYSNITAAPTTLSSFTDDLGNRGFTVLSNFTNDVGYITDVVNDTTPTLGGNLDANSFTITSVANMTFSGDSVNHGIFDNTTCIIILGDTSRLEVC